MAAVCATCGHLNDDGNFCSSCGTVLEGGNLDTGIFPITDDPGVDVAVAMTDVAGIGAMPVGSAILVVTRGPFEGVRYPLDSTTVGTISIGRAPDSDIFLDDVTVSRHHADLSYSLLGWAIADAGSLNGTYVNRARVESCALIDGDEVQVGKYRFVFLSPKA
jgi:pSer/pThr/pTyr-binding forkhead associated (FHA) protein